MFAWDDIAVFLSLIREQTTGRAATALGCSQPTIVRRIAALEQALGVTLFDRTPTGFRPTEAAEKLIESAGRIERAICEFTTDVNSLTGAGSDVMRLTMLDHFERLLVPVLRLFRERWPKIQTELLASDRIYDLTRGEADIAIRGRLRPKDDEIVVHELPASGWTIYASAYTSPDERPQSPDEVANYPLTLIEGTPSTLPIFLWLESLMARGTTPMRCSNYRAIRSAIASGTISALPCTIGDGDPELIRCFPPMQEFDVPIYLLARRVILRRPPGRDLFDSIAAHFNERPTLLTGERN